MKLWAAAGGGVLAAVAVAAGWQSVHSQASTATVAPLLTEPSGATVSPPKVDTFPRHTRARALAPLAPDLPDPTAEERRFARYDKDRSGSISEAEFLANRRKAFDKLDVNHDGKLSFEEYSAKAVAKFEAADRDGDGKLSPEEFATTAAKHRPKPRCLPVEAHVEPADSVEAGAGA